ncbi:hypothetical protein WCD74_08490 [Actinomycetospora sp. OC33-EN08]|uniref:DUF7793 domain-containing protein n=1 Tax=Actinomycetospora aurantiaca TaxID=3129233 RepID=A0ABU8MKG0_9PSEU
MELEDAMAVWEARRGFLRLKWAPGIDIDGPLADAAVQYVNRLNGDQARPLLVDMTGMRMLTRDARVVFTRPCMVSRLALLGRSRVDAMLANFALGVASHPMPMHFFTDEVEAASWLVRGDDPPPRGFRWWRSAEGTPRSR